jgi:hypothetical protein
VTAAATARPRKPAAAPSKAELDERDRFAKRTAESTSMVRASARTWRTGLTAFITLVTTGALITGRTATDDLTSGWRCALTLLIGGGLLLAMIGLWQALAAEAGTNSKMSTLQEIRKMHGTLEGYETHLAAVAARRLRWAQRAVATAVLVLLAGVAATWWAPPAPPTPPAYLIVTQGVDVTCGVLESADGGRLRLNVPGTHEPVVIPLAQVTNLALTHACP